MKLALWPLPLCLLPDGFAQLRIMEPKYQRMVADACQNKLGFAMVLTVNNQLSKVATQVQITDFDKLDDGWLAITIKGINRIIINKINIEADGLKQATISNLPDWPSQKITAQDYTIATNFQRVISRYPHHKQQYNISNFRNISWLCQRWLEILPLTHQQLLYCIMQDDHQIALAMLRRHFKLN